MCHARPSLLTVFSITQSDHSILLLSIHDITDLEMQPAYDVTDVIDKITISFYSESMNKRILLGLLLACVIICLVLFIVVFPGKEEVPEGPPKIVIIGMDGAGWNLINPLLEEDALPHFARMVKKGGHGILKTVRPVKSSVIWTSIATGKSMIKHGVVDWSYINNNNIEVPFRQSERRAKAFWNIFGEMGWTVGIINWFITFPPEEVNGYMVSEEFRHLGRRDFSEVSVTYPEKLLKRLEFVRLRNKDFPRILEQEGLPLFERHKTADEGTSMLAPFYRDFVFQDKTIEKASFYLYKRFPVDVYATYLRIIDVVCHFACAYIDEELLKKGIEEEKNGAVTQETLNQIDRDFSRVMKPFYAYSDRILGRFLELIDPQTTLIVVSDHSFGFNRGGYGHTNLPEIPHGIIMMKGPHIKEDYKVQDAHIYDILPTMLYLFDMPVAEDLDGKVLTEVFTKKFLKSRPIRYIESYEGTSTLKRGKKDTELDKKMMEELRALGYIK